MRTGFTSGAAAMFFASALLLSGCTMTKPQTLSGTVSYRERIALPESAVVEVKLVDVSRADAPAQTIAETIIRPKSQVPVPYVLAYDSARILPNRSYALQARITVGEQLMFINTSRHSVFDATQPQQTDVLVQRVFTPVSSSPTGKWLAEDIRGRGVIDRLQTVLEIAEDGAISGTGGCNRISGKATITGDRIAFGPLAATQMACAQAAMDQEGKFFAALGDVKAWRVDSARQKLTLLGEDGRALIVFAWQ